MVRFLAKQEFRSGANIREIAVDTLVCVAKRPSSDQGLLKSHGTGSNGLDKMIMNDSLLSDRPEHMNYFSHKVWIVLSRKSPIQFYVKKLSLKTKIRKHFSNVVLIP